MGWYGHGFGMMIWMVLFWVIVLGAGIWLLAMLFPVARRQRPEMPDGREAPIDPAMQVLRQRYAKGEITKEEFEEVRRTLG